MTKNHTQVEKIARAAAKATYLSVLKFAQAQDSKHDQVMGLLQLTTADAKVTDNDGKLIVDFTQYGHNKIDNVKKLLNNADTQRTIAGMYPNGLYFYDVNGRQINLA